MTTAYSRKLGILLLGAGVLSAVACGDDDTYAKCGGMARCAPPDDAGVFDAQVVDASADAAKPFAAELRTLLEIEDQRLLGDARLKAFLASADAQVAARAAEVAGQNRDASLQSDLAALLASSTHPSVRAAAAEALQWLNAEFARTALHAAFAKETTSEGRVGILNALATVGNDDSAAIISTFIDQAAAPTAAEKKAAAVGLTGCLGAGTDAVMSKVSSATYWKFFGYITDPSEAAVRVHAARAVRVMIATPGSAFLSGPEGAQVVSAWANFGDENVRQVLTRTLAKLNTSASLAKLREVASGDTSMLVRTAANAEIPVADVSPETLALLATSAASSDIHLAVSAVSALSARGAAATPHLAALSTVYEQTASVWLKSRLLSLLVRLDPEGGAARVDAAMNSADDLLQAAAIKLAAQRKPATHTAAIYAAASSTKTPVALAALNAIAEDIPADVIVLDDAKAAAKAALASGRPELRTYAFWIVENRKFVDMVPDIVAAANAAKSNELDVVTYAMYVLAKLGATSQLAWIDSHLGSDYPWVGQSAADAHKALNGDDVSAQVRTSLRVASPTPSDEEIATALAGTIEFETKHGVAVVKGTSVSPVAFTRLVSIVKAGKYDGIRVHRDEPAFVGQFGDPTFTGSGGADLLMRTVRTSKFDFTPGTFAVARAYIDDDGSQLFYDRAWNVSLYSNYTPIGDTISGKSAMDALEYGDTIIHARFLPAR